MAEKEKNLFEELSKINVNDVVDKNYNGLTYLSWAYAVSEISKRCDDFTYDIEPYTYDEKLGYMVYTHITINGITKRMWLPVMDGANKSMKDHPYKYTTRNGEKTCEAASMTDINKAYMRCLTKNISMFGLGMYIYAGEDLPEKEEEIKEEKKEFATQDQVDIITGYLKNDTARLKKIYEKFKVSKLNELDIAQASGIIKKLEKEQKNG